MLGFIKRECVNIRQPSTLMILYKSLVRSQLDYGSVIWNNSQNNTISKLERVQRKFVRFFCWKFNRKYQSDMYEETCKELKLPLLSKRRKINDMIFLYKVINGIYDCPSLLNEMNIRVPSFNSRQTDFFYTQASRINARKNSPLIRTMNEYNEETRKNKQFDLAMPEAMFRKCVENQICA